MSSLALRPMLPDDGPMLAALFRVSIEELTAEDYSDDQREAWSAVADDEAAFVRRLAEALTLIATAGGAPVGFASLAGSRIAMLYVAPDHARRGVASLLLDALVKLAGARKVETLTVDASDTALGFFAARGFVPQSRNTVPLAEVWLGNTTMTRKLGGTA